MAGKVKFLQGYIETAKEALKKGDYQKAADMAGVIKKDAYRSSFWGSLTPEEKKILAEIGKEANEISTKANKLMSKEDRKKQSHIVEGLRRVASMLPGQLEEQLKMAATMVEASDDPKKILMDALSKLGYKKKESRGQNIWMTGNGDKPQFNKLRGALETAGFDVMDTGRSYKLENGKVQEGDVSAWLGNIKVEIESQDADHVKMGPYHQIVVVLKRK